MNTSFIYGLYDPRDPEIVRYIGKANDARGRLRLHIAEALKSSRRKTYKLDWIRSLLRCGVEPRLRIIESTTNKTWRERERYWIKEFRERNHPLTNGTDGGEGISNPSIDVREKISASLRSSAAHKEACFARRGVPLSIERRKKIGAANSGAIRTVEQREWLSRMQKGKQGKPHTLESSIKMSVAATGRKHTEATRQKLSAINKGKKASDATRLKMSVSHTGRPCSEETRRKIGVSNSGKVKQFAGAVDGVLR